MFKGAPAQENGGKSDVGDYSDHSDSWLTMDESSEWHSAQSKSMSEVSYRKIF